MKGLWNWFFFLVCLGSSFSFYAYPLRKKQEAVKKLSLRLFEANQRYEALAEKKEELALMVASQSDPAWVELVLMQGLGVVPENFLKVHFKESIPELCSSEKDKVLKPIAPDGSLPSRVGYANELKSFGIGSKK